MLKYFYLTLLLTTSCSLAVNTTALEQAIFSHDYALAIKEVVGLAISHEKRLGLLSIAEEQIIKLRNEIDLFYLEEKQIPSKAALLLPFSILTLGGCELFKLWNNSNTSLYFKTGCAIGYAAAIVISLKLSISMIKFKEEEKRTLDKNYQNAQKIKLLLYEISLL